MNSSSQFFTYPHISPKQTDTSVWLKKGNTFCLSLLPTFLPLSPTLLSLLAEHSDLLSPLVGEKDKVLAYEFCWMWNERHSCVKSSHMICKSQNHRPCRTAWICSGFGARRRFQYLGGEEQMTIAPKRNSMLPIWPGDRAGSQTAAKDEGAGRSGFKIIGTA